MLRRDFLGLAGAATLDAALGRSAFGKATGLLGSEPRKEKNNITLRIAPVSVELAPGVTVRTTGYNGIAPGPILRMREGVPVTVDVFNDTDIEETVHWHGQLISSEVDGSMEEGTPAVPAHGHRRYSFTPNPSGTRWYHTHTIARADLTRGMYSGQFGIAYIEPKSEPGHYDKEVFIAVHQWEPHTALFGPPNNGFEIGYQYASFNDKMLGHGEPIRVKQGQRVLFRILNASATDDLNFALPGHQFMVVAMDGNPVPTPHAVNILRIGVAERVDAVVEMKQPGVWIFGSTKAAERSQGMGTVIEYENQTGDPQWTDPPKETWDYSVFGTKDQPAQPDETFELKFEKIPGEKKRFNGWTINGKSYPDTTPLIVHAGKRYRLLFNNNSGDFHPLHLHRHTFEITKMGDQPVAGVMKDVVLMSRFSTAQVDFVANNPGLTLFHCHAQLHMDFGFMNLIRYA